MCALEPPYAILESLVIAIIEGALVGLPVVVLPPSLLMQDRLFKLEHELRECFIDDGLVLVVVVEDELGQVSVVVEQVSEGEHDVVGGVIDGILGCLLVLQDAVLPPVLDELRELFLDGAAQVSHLVLLFSLDQHGAKL